MLVSLTNQSIGRMSPGTDTGRAILEDVTLTINDGERVALIGESGAGKTTLLHHLYMQCQARAALIPQDLGLAENLSVFHNIYAGRLNTHGFWSNLRMLALPTKACRVELQALLDTLEIDGKLFARPTTLSGGQRQRVAIGRALYQSADAVIADEPCSALDDRQAKRMMDRLTQAHESCVFAMHDVGAALTFASRVIGLKEGCIEFDVPVDHVGDAQIAALYSRT